MGFLRVGMANLLELAGATVQKWGMKTSGILLYVMMAGVLAAEPALTEAQFEEAVEQSKARAMEKHASLVNDPFGGFMKFCKKEIRKAEAADDVIFESSNWPEVIADRVQQKYYPQETVGNGAQAVAAAPMPAPEPAPAPAPQYAPVHVSNLTPKPAEPQGLARYFESYQGVFYVRGSTWKGTIHRINVAGDSVWVTADWNNYGGSWVKVADLDPITRTNLGIGSREDVAYAKEQERQERQKELQARQMAINAAKVAEADLRRREAEASERRAAALEQQVEMLRRQQQQQQRQQIVPPLIIIGR